MAARELGGGVRAGRRPVGRDDVDVWRRCERARATSSSLPSGHLGCARAGSIGAGGGHRAAGPRAQLAHGAKGPISGRRRGPAPAAPAHANEHFRRAGARRAANTRGRAHARTARRPLAPPLVTGQTARCSWAPPAMDPARKQEVEAARGRRAQPRPLARLLARLRREIEMQLANGLRVCVVQQVGGRPAAC